MEKPIVCLYHNSCIDGIMAATVLYTAFVANSVEFIPVDYNEDYAAKLAGKLYNKTVFIVDFSIEPKILLPLIEDAARVIMLDHHASAVQKWSNMEVLPDNLEVVFDITKSGARLAWEYMFPDEVPLLAILHAEDRDLWKFTFPETAAHMAYIRAQPWMRLQDFEEIAAHVDKYQFDAGYRRKVQEKGEAIAQARNELVHDILKTSLNFVHILGHRIPVAAMPKAMHSEAGQILYETYPDAPFTITYSDQRHRGMREYSFRSRKNGGANVRIVAEILHGGGHDNAAGVAVPLSDELMLENLTSLMVEERVAYRDEFYHKLEQVILKHWYDFSKETSGSRAAKDFFQHGLVGK